MKLKRPSVKGKSNYKHLGHFTQDKYVCEGHNTVPGQTYIQGLLNASLSAQAQGEKADPAKAFNEGMERGAKRADEQRKEAAALAEKKAKEQRHSDFLNRERAAGKEV